MRPVSVEVVDKVIGDGMTRQCQVSKRQIAMILSGMSEVKLRAERP